MTREKSLPEVKIGKIKYTRNVLDDQTSYVKSLYNVGLGRFLVPRATLGHMESKLHLDQSRAQQANGAVLLRWRCRA